MKTLVNLGLALAAGIAGSSNVSADFVGHFALPTPPSDHSAQAGGNPVSIGAWSLNASGNDVAELVRTPLHAAAATSFSLSALTPPASWATLQIAAVAPTTLSFGWLSTVDHPLDKVSYFVNATEHVLASGNLGFQSGSVLNLALGTGDVLKFYVYAQDNDQTLQVQSFSVSAVPEPSTIAMSAIVLLGVCGSGIAAYRRKAAVRS